MTLVVKVKSDILETEDFQKDAKVLIDLYGLLKEKYPPLTIYSIKD